MVKLNYLIPIIIILGITILFFFPSPEDNFLAYLGTALFFIILVIFLLKKEKYIHDRREKK